MSQNVFPDFITLLLVTVSGRAILICRFFTRGTAADSYPKTRLLCKKRHSVVCGWLRPTHQNLCNGSVNSLWKMKTRCKIDKILGIKVLSNSYSRKGSKRWATFDIYRDCWMHWRSFPCSSNKITTKKRTLAPGTKHHREPGTIRRLILHAHKMQIFQE